MANIQTVSNTGSDGRFLDNFKGRLSGGGARPNLFEVTLDFPKQAIPENGNTKDISDKITFLVKATSLPASNITPIPVPFRGRVLQIAGDRTFDPWQITVINDQDFGVRSAFERWMNWINKHSDNSGQIDPASYQRDASVHQLGRAPTQTATTSDTKIPILRTYRMYGVFPTNVSAISLSYDANNQIEEFTVDLQMQWWEAYNANNAIDVK
jgi:hypothetical protein